MATTHSSRRKQQLSPSTLRQNELHARLRERAKAKAEALAAARYLDEYGVELLFALRVASLRTWRCRGGGPPYVKRGKQVRYEAEAVERWLRGEGSDDSTVVVAGGGR